jgi:hypothetical protein
MANQDISAAQFVGSIRQNYVNYLGPLLFRFAANDLARRVGNAISSKSRILEIA